MSRKESNVWCPLPWIGLSTNPDGTVMPCCLHWSSSNFWGNIKTQTYEEIMNSPKAKTMRKEMMNNIEPKGCGRCYRKEEVLGESFRTILEEHHPWTKQVKDTVRDITDEDGTLKEVSAKYWDVRFSNICNMACIMCGPEFSSKWQAELKTVNGKILNNFDDKNKTYEFIDNHAKNVQSIYFAGGEPLVMDEHYYILEKLIDMGRTDVNLHYNSNILKLTHKNKDSKELWKNFKRVSIAPSIDAMESQAEYIRYGTVWSQLQNNLFELRDDPDIWVGPQVTVGVYNVIHFTKLIKFFLDNGLEDYDFNMIDGNSYNIIHMPQSLKQEAKDNLISFANSLSAEHKKVFLSKSKQIVKKLNIQTTQTEHINFVKKIKEIDRTRNLNFTEHFPEISRHYDFK
tara:strand:- start:1641 stop:2837 length:1197 start_codon:yes stop_codon:yes gene_type:complete